jgi:hypothetical protein
MAYFSPVNYRRNAMSLNEYAKRIVDLIKSRPAKMDFNQLMYRVYVLAEISEGEGDIEQGRWRTQEEVMEGLWRRPVSKSVGAELRSHGSGKSSKKSNRKRR